MSLNDQKERLDIAEEYLLTFPASSQEFESALEHLEWVVREQPECRGYVGQIFQNVVTRRRGESHVMSKLGSFKI